MNDTFSVVIPTRNRVAEVSALVDRLERLDAAPDQIVVVDDGSTDGTVATLRGRGPGAVPLVVVDGPSDGPASARNLGVESATSEWLVFLDDDDEPDADWMSTFRRLVADSAPSGSDPSHLSVGFRVRRDGMLTDMGIEDLGPAFGDAHANILAGTFAVRRTRFDAIGGFLDGLRHMEFTELALRLFERWSPGELGVVVEPASHLTIVARSIADRVSQHPEVLAETGLRVLATTDHLWQRDRRRYADQLATFGVAAIRAGRGALGRRWLVKAFIMVPTSWRHAARAALSLVPPLARRVWVRP